MVSDECPFCARIDRGEFIERLGTAVVRFAPLNPVVDGHMLFVPVHHVGSVAEYPLLAGVVFAEAARYAADAMQRGMAFNLITSAGVAATQSVRHLHVHFVPRRFGDGLALPWTGQRV